MTPPLRSASYRICTRCVMDTSDPEIVFDDDGVCSHCHFFARKVMPRWHPDERGEKLLREMIADIKRRGRGKPYDSIIGLSGGVDSSYLAVKLVEWGLRPLAVHVDAGWNSELAVKNIEEIVGRLGLDLHTVVIDWEAMRDLQLAFLRANVANQDTPQDHAFFASLYRYALGKGIKRVISGANYATESILPSAWGYSPMDVRHIKAIHRRFGGRPLRSFPLAGTFDVYVNFPYLRRLEVVAPLNYMPYRKTDAIAHLEKHYGWRYYGGKHYESRWTRFFQAYYLPSKFGYDKRRAHLASLVVAGEMTREEALAELQKPLYTANELAEDKAFVAKKLRLGVAELDALVAQPPRHYSEFPNSESMFKMLLAGARLARGAAQRFRRLPGGAGLRARAERSS